MISIDFNKILIDHYIRIEYADCNEMRIECQEYLIILQGKQLKILVLGKDELLIQGMFKQLGFRYES
ncbi:MAG: YabP/YqfC family sporulation protein [Erysipelotrichaceae bacterium]